GNPLPGFSLELPHRASYSATVYEDDNDMQLFVPAGDRILAYDAEGKALPGWSDHTLTGDIQYDVKQVNIQDTHYIVAATASGNVYFYNNNGRLVFRNETAESVSFRNPVALQHAPDDAVTAPHVLTTDTAGVLRRFYFENRQ